MHSTLVSWRLAVLLIGILTLTGCFPVEERIRIAPANVNDQTIYSATKAHLKDGSVILFEDGFRARRDTLFGIGDRYGIDRIYPLTQAWKIPLDSVIGMEYYEHNTPGSRVPGEILIASATYVPLVVFLGLAIFGSCPTIYSGSGNDRQLEAECFSHSISPMFERPDMDRLEIRDTASGKFTLQLLNEALETHYIDQMQLGFVDHPHATQVHSISDDETIIVSGITPMLSARNSEGRDVLHSLSFKDGNTYAVDSTTADRMFRRGRRDHIDITVKLAPEHEELAIVMRGRNTLQNTILFYDLMMRDQGVGVLEWSGTISKNILAAYRIHQWYQQNSGVIISVKEGDVYREKARIRDTGPIAWKTAARVLTLPRHDSTVSIRLSFVPDSWSIDMVEFDSTISEPVKPAFLESPSIIRHEHAHTTVDPSLMSEDDGKYFITYPGESMDLNYVVPPLSSDERTYFIRAKGYYIEWVRGEWLKEREYVHAFDPTEPEYIRRRLAKLWLKRKNTFEAEFFNFKVPTNAEKNVEEVGKHD